MFARELTFIVIAFILVVPATVFLSFSASASDVCAAKKDRNFYPGGNCKSSLGAGKLQGSIFLTCCWEIYDPVKGEYITQCQTCEKKPGEADFGHCDSVRGAAGGLFGIPLPEGDLPVLEQVPPPILQPVVPQEGTIEAPAPGQTTTPSGSEEIQETPVLEEVPCPEGFERDEETGQCVPIESPVTEEPEEAPEEPEEEQSEPEEEQSSEESDSGDESNN